MNTSWKNILLTLTLLVLLGGVGYLGLKIVGMNSSPTTPASVTAEPTDEEILANPNLDKPKSTSACTASSDCLTVSQPTTAQDGSEEGFTLRCKNRSYLEDCPDCSLKIDIPLESTCTCVNNKCTLAAIPTQ